MAVEQCKLITFVKKEIEKLNIPDGRAMCYLYYDEGGMFGTPKFLLSVKKVKLDRYHKEYFTLVIGCKWDLTKFILGRLLYWNIIGDYKIEDCLKTIIKEIKQP